MLRRICKPYATPTPPQGYWQTSIARRLLPSTSLTSAATAGSGGHIVHGNNGFGNGGRDGSPSKRRSRSRAVVRPNARPSLPERHRGRGGDSTGAVALVAG